MAQATSGKIAFFDWLRRVTRRSVIFVNYFVYKGRTKGNFEKQEKINKLSTKSSMSPAMSNLKVSFTIMEAITTKTTILDITILSRYTYIRYDV